MYMVYMYICAGVATSSRTTHAHTTSNACIAGPPPLEIVVQVTLNPGQTKPNPSPAPSYITDQDKGGAGPEKEGRAPEQLFPHLQRLLHAARCTFQAKRCHPE
ncbi:predicted protein [Histoplasma capsulatum H143]|uniref:Uncharacterized protein n=1 Tax=Ajellomyces capsulatus (strain H143) TaxID=544712 RepID=C6H572_AJECH|nr:predicted protein [Histoplasma capsulatum H143]